MLYLCITIIKERMVMEIKRLKNKTIVGNLLYAQVRFGLYKVFDKENKYLGFASGVGEKIFC